MGSFNVTFLPENKTVTLPNDGSNDDLSDNSNDNVKSLLDYALDADIELDHACGGVCACSTCHIIIQEGLETCNEMSDAEADQLDKAPGLTTRSRLACQCIPSGEKDLIIEIPAWNRNSVRE